MLYSLYILKCADGTFYTGITTDVERSVSEHNGLSGNGAKYTSARRPVELVYEAIFFSARQREPKKISAGFSIPGGGGHWTSSFLSSFVQAAPVLLFVARDVAP